MSSIIQVNHVSKEYRLGVIGHGTLTKDLQSLWARILGKEDPNSKIDETSRVHGDRFWALKDVSFDIEQGDRIGIIGRNGAGKSTLLKILSRVTTPTSGSIKIKGRVASLLEVGTGFHPELTGRENIYLNGAILGMTTKEVKRKFDEIVDFAGVEYFIDTPVKRYSSGMYVRLAFAVAAHLDPDILIVDEVLAVGDANFQKKCLGKMEDVSKNQGRTVLFVSHSLNAISNLCENVIWMKDGRICENGIAKDVIKSYFNELKSTGSNDLITRTDREGNGAIRFVRLDLINREGENTSTHYSGESLKILLFFEQYLEKVLNLNISIGIDNHMGERILLLGSDIINSTFNSIDKDQDCIEIFIPKLPLNSGRYYLTLFGTVNGEIADWVQNVAYLDVEISDYYGNGKIPDIKQGYFLADYKISLKVREEGQ
ncbi:ABC transporter ATP-binding protein [Leptospira sp. WS60.C2]